MACKTSYEFHHHFPKVAEESGFTFNTHRPRVHLDWNKIKLIDMDNLVRERKFIIIEQHLNDILDCVLESEFDVRILDEGVIKLFRLAQLAVEYQQFCRHYLDRSVYVLRQEITSLTQDLDITKRNLLDKEEELRKLRKLTKNTHKSLLPYGNENIATMILNTLNNKGVLFPASSNTDIHQYNMCNDCGKVFLNQLYLQSHRSRRHPNIIESPKKDTQNGDQHNENNKLSNEVTELKHKLIEMETIVAKYSREHRTLETQKKDISKCDSSCNIKKDLKDAAVSTNNDIYLIDKFEEWKKAEREEYNKEINKLRNQIMEIINSSKGKEEQEYLQKDNKLIEQFQATIIQQGAEILALRKELDDSKIKLTNDNSDTNREAEKQLALSAKRTESQQYELLLEKLNDVANDAKESRALAMAERERAAQLQTLLEQNLHNKVTENTNQEYNSDKIPEPLARPAKQLHVPRSLPYKSSLIENKNIENLRRKAQELLNIGSLSSSSSDVSNNNDNVKPMKKLMQNKRKIKDKLHDSTPSDIEEKSEKISKLQKQTKVVINERRKTKVQKNKHLIKNDTNVDKRSVSGSPIKIVRAKLTEEVNNRLTALGIDPLKRRLTQCDFQNQRTQLQQLRDLKTKKNPGHEKLRHSLLAYLDSSTNSPKNEENFASDYISPNKVPKPFRNITSVMSGVKNKALSLVKLNERQHKSLDSDVSKRALSLLKTPPGSTSDSPQRNTGSKPKIDSSDESHDNVIVSNFKTKKHMKKWLVNSSSESSIRNDQDDSKDVTQKSSKSIENLIKSPARRPSFANTDYEQTVKKYVTTNSNNNKTDSVVKKVLSVNNIKDIDGLNLSSTVQLNKSASDENLTKQTKGVLKNASSTSTLNKKKVIFDMDAIQMKSLSASPSQSTTEKSNSPHNYELGLDNLNGEEWDVSSIENEPLKNDTKLQFRTSTSPKIAELKQQIESQLARRMPSASTGLVGAVDVLGLGVSVSKVASNAGSNTSLGSSILDDSENDPVVNNKTFVKSKTLRKNDSDVEVSDFSLDGIVKNDTF